MERIKLVTMLIISFSVSGAAPQGSQASGAGRGQEGSVEFGGGSPGVQAGRGSVL